MRRFQKDEAAKYRAPVSGRTLVRGVQTRRLSPYGSGLEMSAAARAASSSSVDRRFSRSGHTGAPHQPYWALGPLSLVCEPLDRLLGAV